MWPRAESVVYEEPKRLVARGLARSRTEHTGKRPRTVYSITPKGRRALREWLGEPGAAPQVEFEGLLKVAFADHGSLEGLRTNLAAIRARAEDELRRAEERAREYVTTGGPFPDRLPVISLAHRWFAEQALAALRWVEWAEGAIEPWSGVTSEDGASTPPDAFEVTHHPPS
jgi:DNA-binding PadR family transcriptional regulator